MLFTAATALAALASLVSSVAAAPTVVVYDDAQTDKISYKGGNWVHLKNQGGSLREGTESYSADGAAYYTIKEVFGNLEIHGGKKFDRGQFDIYCDNEYIGTGDAYDASCKTECASMLLWSGNLPQLQNIAANQVVTVRNRPYDFRTGKTPYIDLDYIVFN